MAGRELPKIDSARAKELQKLSAQKRKKNRQEKMVIKEMLEKRLGVDDLNIILDNLIDRAKNNSTDFTVLRDTLGQKPIDKSEVDVSANVINVEIE